MLYYGEQMFTLFRYIPALIQGVSNLNSETSPADSTFKNNSSLIYKLCSKTQTLTRYRVIKNYLNFSFFHIFLKRMHLAKPNLVSGFISQYVVFCHVQKFYTGTSGVNSGMTTCIFYHIFYATGFFPFFKFFSEFLFSLKQKVSPTFF